jgi:hypothetical protein
VDEWQALPWWQQKLYIDQLAMDLAAERGDEPEAPASFEQHAAAAAAAQSAPPTDPDAYLRSMGFNL